jgi:hypothetical protein
VVKYAASFTSNPVLNPDTLYARTAGVMSWVSAHATSTSINIGTLAESKNSATIPPQETSTSATITLTGEDGTITPKTVPVPVYDTVFSFICKNSPVWHTDSLIKTWAGGHTVLPPDPLPNWIYYRDRTARALRADGTLSNPGTWYHLNDGAQYGDGQWIWNNVFIGLKEVTPNNWKYQWIRVHVEGIYTYTAYATHQ